MQNNKKTVWKSNLFPKQARSKILFGFDPSDIGELWFVVTKDLNNSLTSLKNIYILNIHFEKQKKILSNLTFFQKASWIQNSYDFDPNDIGELWFAVMLDMNHSLTSLKQKLQINEKKYLKTFSSARSIQIWFYLDP